MEKEYKKGEHIGYKIGNDVLIHEHINDPDSWFITIRALQIFGHSLCKKTCIEQEIARHANVVLHKHLGIINLIIKTVVPFT